MHGVYVAGFDPQGTVFTSHGGHPASAVFLCRRITDSRTTWGSRITVRTTYTNQRLMWSNLLKNLPGHQGSNLEPLVLETSALPIEL